MHTWEIGSGMHAHMGGRSGMHARKGDRSGMHAHMGYRSGMHAHMGDRVWHACTHGRSFWHACTHGRSVWHAHTLTGSDRSPLYRVVEPLGVDGIEHVGHDLALQVAGSLQTQRRLQPVRQGR